MQKAVFTTMQLSGDMAKQPALAALIYARTSGPDSMSARDQIDICRRRCQERGWQVRYVLKDEGMSGGDAERPGYQALWEHATSGSIGVLVTWKMDRIARSLAEMSNLEEALRECGVSLHSCTELVDTTTAQGRFIFGILASAGELERGLAGERVRSMLSERARRGMWMHRTPPFGYCFGKNRCLRINEAEAAAVRRCFALHHIHKSYSETAAALNHEKMWRRGKRWTAGTVQRILENRLHVGEFRHWGHKLARANLRIVDDDVWNQAQETKQTNARAGQRASESVRRQSIKNVFDQYIDGLDHLDDNAELRPVSGTRKRRARANQT